MSRHVRFGIFLAPFHALDENPVLAIERDFELVEWLDRLDYDEAWIGEHHSGGFEIIACPEIFIAAAAERTRRIRLGTGVVSLPYHHPFMIADRILQLDYMTRGRTMFGVGPGALTADADKMGIPVAEQRRRMDEAVSVLVPLLRGETVNRKTDWFELRDARLQMECYTKPMVEMAVASARSPVGARTAGKYGLGMLSIGSTTDSGLAAHASNWKTCEAISAENGHQADRSRWRVVSMMHVAETRAQAERDVEFGLERWLKYFREITTFPIVPEGVDDHLGYMRENGIASIGTPDDAINAIERLWEGSRRRVRLLHALRPQLGGLGADEAQLRAHRALRDAALPVAARRALRQLRRLRREQRAPRRRGAEGGPARDRPPPGGTGPPRRDRRLADHAGDVRTQLKDADAAVAPPAPPPSGARRRHRPTTIRDNHPRKRR